jgi:hypothetical protein
MNRKKTLAIFLVLCALSGPVALGAAPEPAVTAKRWPPGYFLQYQQAPVKEKEQVLADLQAALARLNREGNALIAKGTVIDRPDTRRKTYDRLAILDDSGLLIIARRVPNLYYGYQGPAPLNPNIYLLLKNPRVNVNDSLIRGKFVVEGDYVAFAHKFVEAIMEGLEGAAHRELEPPAKRQPQ